MTPLSGIATTNGINRVGLYMIGRPKINGSLMLKIAGISPSLPTVLICLDLLVAARTARPSVAPLPPMVMKVHQNGSFTMYGRDTAAVPAANAAMFAL